MRLSSVAILALSLAMLNACDSKETAQPQSPKASIQSASFGQTSEGVAVELYTLRNARGMEARIATYGGTVTRLTAPDRKGQYADVVLGYDTLDGYLKNSPYFGALIG